MKQHYFTAFGVMAAFALNAQITLNQANTASSVGDSLRVEVQQTTPMLLHNGGQNLSWDWSTISGTRGTFNYVAKSAGTIGSQFPNATIIEAVSGAENYTSVTATGMALEGHYIVSGNNTSTTKYTDKRETIFFPIKFGDTKNESFAGTVVNFIGQTFNRNGTIEIKADAEGTMKLPDNSVTNVIRVRSILNYSDFLNGTKVFDYTDTIYAFYDGVNTGIFAAWSIGYVGTRPFVQGRAQYRVSSGNNGGGNNGGNNGGDTTSIAENEFINEISVFPSPSNGRFKILHPKNIRSLKVISAAGSIIRETNIEHKFDETTIDITGTESGVYFILVEFENGDKSTKKLIIE